MGDGGLINTDSDGEILLTHVEALAQRGDPRMDGTLESLALAFHTSVVDQRSTFVNYKYTTDLLAPMQLLECMGDKLHKRSPPDGEVSEPVTQDFRDLANRTLAYNESVNELTNIKKGQPGYRIASQRDLAEAIADAIDRPFGQRMLSKILGGVRDTTEVELVQHSVYVRLIRKLLDLPTPSTTEIAVPAVRARVLQLIALLPEADFAAFEKAIDERMAKSAKRR